MCVAIVKPMGIALPTDEILERCFRKNQDGAGIAFQNKNKTGFNIVKGLMTYDAFKRELEKVIEAMGGKEKAEAALMLLHFRIGTHGSKSDPKHTHPFPLTSRLDRLEALQTSSAQVCMHNGILSGWGTSSYGVYGKAEKGISDTMDFIKNFVYPLEHQILAKEDSIWKNEKAQSFITREVSGSRFVIANGRGGFLYWGTWHKHEGCMYSNKDYEPYVPQTYGYSYSGYGRTYYNPYTDSFSRDSYEDAWGQGSSTPLLPPAAPETKDKSDPVNVIRMSSLLPGVKHITKDMVDSIANEFEFLHIGKKHGVRVFFKSIDNGDEYEFDIVDGRDAYLDPKTLEVWVFSWVNMEFRYMKTASSYMLKVKDSEDVWTKYVEV